MPRVSYAYFSLAALFGLIGTIWGEHMGRTNDHATFIAHAHLNLVGWVSMAVMGVPMRWPPPWVAWVNLALQAVGAACLTIAMLFLMALADMRFVPVAIIGSLCAILGMATFLASVLLSWRNSARA